MTKEKIFKLPLEPLRLSNFLTLAGSGLSLIAFFFLANELRQFHSFSQVPYLSLATHLALWASGGGVLIGVFGWKFIKMAIQTFWKATLISLVLATSFYFSFSTIFKLWPYLSAVVLWAVSRMLALTQDSVVIVPPLTIQLREFSVTIGEYCSGIESLFLISALYILIGCLERERIRLIRFILAFFPLLVGMFSLNIIRVYGIILAGLWFGPEIAAKLFHTYLGMILFLSYFVLFWKFSASSLLIKSSETEKQ
jgi:exosortase/archaeosortase family protein